MNKLNSDGIIRGTWFDTFLYLTIARDCVRGLDPNNISIVFGSTLLENTSLVAFNNGIQFRYQVFGHYKVSRYE